MYCITFEIVPISDMYGVKNFHVINVGWICRLDIFLTDDVIFFSWTYVVFNTIYSLLGAFCILILYTTMNYEKETV